MALVNFPSPATNGQVYVVNGVSYVYDGVKWAAAVVPPNADASETAKGIVELATAAETTTGTDATRAVHPAGLKVELDKKVDLAGGEMTGPLTVQTTLKLKPGAGDEAYLYLDGAANGGYPRLTFSGSTANSGKDAGLLGIQTKGFDGTIHSTYLGSMADTSLPANAAQKPVYDSLFTTLRAIHFDAKPNISGGGLCALHDDPVNGVLTFRAVLNTSGGVDMSGLYKSKWFNFTVTSDQRLKSEKEKGSSLSILLSLKPRVFEYKEHPTLSHSRGKRWGFYAQELEQVLPTAVREREEPTSGEEGDQPLGGTYKVLSDDATAQLCAVLVDALQTAVTRIESLEAAVAALTP